MRSFRSLVPRALAALRPVSRDTRASVVRKGWVRPRGSCEQSEGVRVRPLVARGRPGVAPAELRLPRGRSRVWDGVGGLFLSPAPTVRCSALACVPQRLLSSCPEFGDYPGDAHLRFTDTLDTHAPGTLGERMPVYRQMNEDGTMRPGVPEPDVDRDTTLKMYEHMHRLQAMDQVLYDAQRQGRISFYMTSTGEEGIHIGSAMSWKADDPVYAQYRETGVLMWRGFSLQNFADQCFSNAGDYGKGRQMPVHYGSKEHHFFTISSPLTTQLPQATGTAYALKLEGKGRVCVCYFGEGAASEGDFHAGLNFATTLKAPVVFFCRNNGYAISTPVKDQYSGDGIAARGIAYGMHTIRVDGNDVFAVRAASMKAREIAATGNVPVLIEAMTYREGHHSTSDDSTRYRSVDEIKAWRAKANPIARLNKYLVRRGWWSSEQEDQLVKAERKAVLTALATAEKKPKPGVEHLFTDVYADIPEHLRRQSAQLAEHMAKYPDKYTHSGH